MDIDTRIEPFIETHLLKITEEDSVSKIIYFFRDELYSKHNEWDLNLIPIEIEVVKKVMKLFVKELNYLIEKYNWKAKIILSFPEHIAFENLTNKNTYKYYDMEEIEKRKIDYEIDNWLNLNTQRKVKDT